MKQVNYGILHSDVSLISKLQWLSEVCGAVLRSGRECSGPTMPWTLGGAAERGEGLVKAQHVLVSQTCSKTVSLISTFLCPLHNCSFSFFAVDIHESHPHLSWFFLPFQPPLDPVFNNSP